MLRRVIQGFSSQRADFRTMSFENYSLYWKNENSPMELMSDDLWWAQETNMEVIFKGQKKLKMGIRFFAILEKLLSCKNAAKFCHMFQGVNSYNYWFIWFHSPELILLIFIKQISAVEIKTIRKSAKKSPLSWLKEKAEDNDKWMFVFDGRMGLKLIVMAQKTWTYQRKWSWM